MRKLIRPVSTSRASRLRVYRYLRQKFLFANPWCRACKVRRLKIQSQATEIHHSRGRAGRLLVLREFFIPVCANCHEWIHAHVNEAREKGLICQKGSWNSVPK